jgi:hypothetical protein
MFATSILIIVFAYGFAVGRHRWFPDAVIHSGASAALDLGRNWKAYFGSEPTRLLQPSRGQPAGALQLVPAGTAPGVTFMSSFFEGDIGLALISADGKIFHRWPLRYFEIFTPDEVEQIGNSPQGNWGAAMMGATILDDGAVIFTFNNGGLVKLDKCGKMIWKRTHKTHHSVVVDDDGSLWVPSTLRAYEPGDTVELPGLSAPFIEESVLHLDSGGNVIEEMSIPRLIEANGLFAMMMANGDTRTTNTFADYTHLNKVDVLGKRMAPAFPLFAAGDLLLSFRHLNLVMVVEPRTWRVKWHQIGPWLRQHDAEFRLDGKISVFDNRTDNHAGELRGGSRIVAMDPGTRAVSTVYAGRKDSPFYTDVEGEHVYLPNSNLLISESMAGRIFEVDSAGTVVWQFVNAYDSARVVGETHAYARLTPEFVASIDWSCRE